MPPRRPAVVHARRPGRATSPPSGRPADVFYFANYLAAQSGGPPPYTVQLAARRAGPVATASGPSIHADRAVSDPDLRPDVPLVAGGLAVGAAARAARHLVVYLQRAGGQDQYSAHLAAQRTAHPTLDDLLAHIADHPDRDLTVRALATHVAMSERGFQRPFTREVGVSPGRYVERVRIDTARRLLEHTDDGLTAVARRCGFTTVETFHRAFRRRIGVTPTAYRQRFSARASADDPDEGTVDGGTTPATGGGGPSTA